MAGVRAYKEGRDYKTWKDFDSLKTYAVYLDHLPRKVYEVYSPREALDRYRSDLHLASIRPIEDFIIHEVRNG